MHSNKRFVTGFPYIANWTLVDFRHDAPADRVCSLCGVLPAETLWTPCRHVFCRRCFQGLASTGNGDLVTCPVDGAEYASGLVRVDRSAPEQFRHYPVGCKNKGCLHVPTLATYEKHIALCEHQLVLCELCSRRLQVSQVLPHVKNDCRKTSGRALEGRTATSPVRTVAALDAEQHAERCEVVSQELKSLRLTIHEELRSFKDVLEAAKASLVEDKSWKTQQQQQEAGEAHQVMVDSVVDSLGRELRDAVSEDATPTSCYVWKVGDFAKLRSDALEGKIVSFSSDAFYCGGAGYRMYLQGSLGGGTPGNPSLGFYFVLTAGSFDTSLSWPYCQKTSFMLVSNGGAYNVQGDIRPETEGDEWRHCFRKPKPGEDNEGFGFSQFIALEDLCNPNYGYLRDNSFTVHFLTQLRV